ncbi:MAG: penicillin-binding transpeptidase domain-containing protein [Candidatus Paceibacterota bacterium]|jgi:penicillin-binding protein 2
MFYQSRLKSKELDPDEIFLDSSNLPEFDNQQFEGRLEKAITKNTILFFLLVCVGIFLVFILKTGHLQLIRGKNYANRSLNNTLNLLTIFPDRGNIYDCYGKELAWNDRGRKYNENPAFGHILGYLGYPSPEDMAQELYESKELSGKSGVEKQFNELLAGAKGVKIVEVNARGETESDHIVNHPKSGKDLTLSIDSRVQAKLYDIIGQVVVERGFVAGGGVIMDTQTGEILAMASYPGYDSNAISLGNDSTKINSYFNDNRNPLLNRLVLGLYTPGSIFKPFIAAAALAENIIDPQKTIFSHGQLEIINPYNPKLKTIFKDWKAHGAVDMRRAIAVSSNVYFYVIGGGFGDQVGLGIKNIKKYAEMFGLARPTGIDLPSEAMGSIPSVEWKAKNFDGEPWRIGDTYHTVIGQYGMLVTPIQIVRAYAAIANGGKLIQPTIRKLSSTKDIQIVASLPIKSTDFEIVREGMRLGVLEGTAKGLDTPSIKIAAKTGTAELGVSKEKVNSWVTGFFPYENPRYSFVVVMEKGPRNNTIGGVFVMRQLFDWMAWEIPEYLQTQNDTN